MNQYRTEQLQALMNNYPRLFMTDDQKWNDRYEALVMFLHTNERRPSTYSRDLAEMTLARWVTIQQQHYRTNTHPMRSQARRAAWENVMERYPQFFRTDDQIWADNLNRVRVFIDRNDRIPSRASTDVDESRLGAWLHMQRRNIV